MVEPNKNSSGVYVMQVACMLTGMHPQTLRKYERAGLLKPVRRNRFRLYSEDDIALLKMLKNLVEEGGLNLAGLSLALEIRTKLMELKEIVNSTGMENESKKQITTFVDEIIKALETCAPAKALRSRILTHYKGER